MSRPGERFAEPPALPAHPDGPVFEEPWQASAFALAVHLSERGAISWTEWSAALGREIGPAAFGGAIQTATAERNARRNQAYYHHWLSALERLCTEKGLIVPAEIRRRQDEWRAAYLNTPHGQPVELAAATADHDR